MPSSNLLIQQTLKKTKSLRHEHHNLMVLENLTAKFLSQCVNQNFAPLPTLHIHYNTNMPLLQGIHQPCKYHISHTIASSHTKTLTSPRNGSFRANKKGNIRCPKNALVKPAAANRKRTAKSNPSPDTQARIPKLEKCRSPPTHHGTQASRLTET